MLNRRNVEQSTRLKLCLLSKASFIEVVSYALDWGNVIVSLENEHNCETERISTDIFRIHKADGARWAVIEIKNNHDAFDRMLIEV